MTAPLISYFGYGSLVNRETRPAGELAVPATLSNWRRAWAHRVQGSSDRLGSCCSLTIEQLAPGDMDRVSIDGVLVTIPRSELPDLDAREAGYERIELPASAFRLPGECAVTSVFVYVSAKANNNDANDEYPVLQSYIDCVMAGFEARFSTDGVHRFLASTRGWQSPIENDRLRPRYPRAVTLENERLQHYDSLLHPHRWPSGKPE